MHKYILHINTHTHTTSLKYKYDICIIYVYDVYIVMVTYLHDNELFLLTLFTLGETSSQQPNLTVSDGHLYLLY